MSYTDRNYNAETVGCFLVQFYALKTQEQKRNFFQTMDKQHRSLVARTCVAADLKELNNLTQAVLDLDRTLTILRHTEDV